jgi:hypothetical protein
MRSITAVTARSHRRPMNAYDSTSAGPSWFSRCSSEREPCKRVSAGLHERHLCPACPTLLTARPQKTFSDTGSESAGWTVVPSRVVTSRRGRSWFPRVRFAVAPFPDIRRDFQNGPEQSRARGLCAAERTLDGEDRSETWHGRERVSGLHSAKNFAVQPMIATGEPKAKEPPKGHKQKELTG